MPLEHAFNVRVFCLPDSLQWLVSLLGYEFKSPALQLPLTVNSCVTGKVV